MDKESGNMKQILDECIASRDLLLNENATLTKSLSELKRSSESIEEEAKRLKDQVETQKGHVALQKNEIEELRKELQETREKLTLFKKETKESIDLLTKEKDDMLVEKESLVSINQTLERTIEGLEAKEKENQSKLTQQQNERFESEKMHKSKIDELERKEKELQEELGEVKVSNGNLSTQVETLLRNREEEKRQLENELRKSIMDELNQNKETIQKLQQENELLNKDLENARLRPFKFLGLDDRDSNKGSSSEQNKNMNVTLKSLCDNYIKERDLRVNAELEIKKLNETISKMEERSKLVLVEIKQDRIRIDEVLEKNEVLSKSLNIARARESELDKDLKKKVENLTKLEEKVIDLEKRLEQKHVQLKYLLKSKSYSSAALSTPEKESSSQSQQLLYGIQDNLLVFANESELIAKNEKLLDLVSKLEEENKCLKEVSKEQAKVEAQKALSDAQKEIEKLREARNQQQLLFETLVHQRDNYKETVAQLQAARITPNPTPSPTPPPTTITSQHQNNIHNDEVENLPIKEKLEKVTKEYEIFRKEMVECNGKQQQLIDDTRKELERAKIALGEHQANAEFEKRRSEYLQQSNNDLITEKREIQNLFEVANNQIAELQSTIQSLNSRITTLKSEVQSLQYKQSLSDSEKDIIKRELEQTISHVKELKTQRDMQRKMIQNYEEMDTSRITDLQTKIQQTTSEKEKIEKEMKDLENKLFKSKVDFQHESQALRDEYANNIKILETLKIENHNLKEHISRLENEAALFAQKEKSLQEKLDLEKAINHEIRSKQIENSSLGSTSGNQTHSQIGIEEESLKIEIAQLRRNLAEKDKEIEALRSALATESEKVGEKVEELKQSNAMFEQEKNNILIQLDQSKVEVERLRSLNPTDYEKNMERLHSLEQQKQEDENKINQLVAKLQKIEADNSNRDEELMQLKADYEKEVSLHANTSLLLDSIQKKQREMNSTKTVSSTYGPLPTEDHKDQIKKIQEIITLNGVVSSLKDEKSKLERQVREANTEIKRLTEEVQTLRMKVDASSGSAESIISEKVKLEQELTNLKSKYAELVEKLSQMVDSKEHQKLKQENEENKQKLSAFEASLKQKEEAFETQKSELEQKIKSIELEIQSTKQKHQITQSNVSKQLETLKKNVEEKESELKNLQNQLEAKNMLIKELEEKRKEELDKNIDSSNELEDPRSSKKPRTDPPSVDNTDTLEENIEQEVIPIAEAENEIKVENQIQDAVNAKVEEEKPSESSQKKDLLMERMKRFRKNSTEQSSNERSPSPARVQEHETNENQNEKKRARSEDDDGENVKEAEDQ